MTKVKSKLEYLRKAIKEAGLTFHSPHSITVADALRAPKEPAFEGESFAPTEKHYKDYNSLPHQEKLKEALTAANYKPDTGLTLSEYHGHTGRFSQANNAHVQDVPMGESAETLFSKKNTPLEPHERKDWGIDDRKMSLAQREVAYHNLAHQFFDLGGHVPDSILVNGQKPNEHWNVQKWEHNYAPNNEAETYENLKRLHKSGTFPKLTVMDAILGNIDRHAGNVLYEKGGPGVRYIDNALTFPNSTRVPVPAFYTANQYSHLFNTKMPVQFKYWLQGLRPEKMQELLALHNIPHEESEHVLNRLEKAHKAAEGSENYFDFFRKLAGRV